MDTASQKKRREYERSRSPRCGIQLPKEVAEQGRKLAKSRKETFVRFISRLIETESLSGKVDKKREKVG